MLINHTVGNHFILGERSKRRRTPAQLLVLGCHHVVVPSYGGATMWYHECSTSVAWVNHECSISAASATLLLLYSYTCATLMLQ